MKAYLTKVEPSKNYVVVETYDSKNAKQASLKVPKYFMRDADKVEVGDEVEFQVRAKRKAASR